MRVSEVMISYISIFLPCRLSGAASFTRCYTDNHRVRRTTAGTMYYVRNTRRESAGKTTLLRIALVVTSGALNYLMANPTHLAGASSTTTSGTPDTSSSMLAPDCDATSQQCSNNSVCVACLAAPEDSATTTPSCEERYPDILLDGDLSEDDCGIKGATFCCR